jgi:hypothetical protein
MDERALKRAHALESRYPRRRYAAPTDAAASLRRILPAGALDAVAARE